jgi:hypothetical protein
MRAEVAGGGRIRMTGWVTVLVDLTNLGGEVEAELVVSQPGGPGWGNQPPEYVVPLTLPAGAKKRVPIDLPAFNGSTISVQLRAGGAKIQEQNVQLLGMAQDALLVGLLSDDELGIPALTRLGGEREAASATQVARLTAATFPASGALLDQYDILALSRFDTGSMSPGQMQALESWVARGGTLLLGGGPEWKRSFAALPPALLPVQVTGVRDVDLAGLAAVAGKPVTGKAAVSVGQPQGGEVLASSGEVPLVVVDRVGSGKVIYLAADPSLEPMAGWAGLPDMLDRLLTGRVHSEYIDGNNKDNMMMNALQQLPGLGLPSPWLLGGLLAGYLLLVGPLSYWVLKRKDRREWLWAVVPILSLGFVGAVYGVGFSRQINLISNLITVTEIYPGAQAASITSYVGVYAPSRSRLDVDLGTARLVKPLTSFSGLEGDRPTRIIHGEKTTVQMLGLNNYSMKGFSVEEDATVTGGVELTEIAIDEAGNLTGKLANRLDRQLRDVRITAGGAWVELGTLAPGETSRSFMLDLAGTGRMDKGIPMFAVNFGGPVIDMESQRRNSVMNALFGWNGEQMEAGSIIVTGWTDEPLAKPAIAELGRMTQGVNLVLVKAPIPIDTARGEIPPGVVVGVHSGGPGFGRSPYGYSLGQGAHTFRMTLPAIDPAVVAEVKLHAQVIGVGSRGYDLSIKDQTSGEWVPLESTPVQALKTWQTYVGGGGQIELLVDVAEHVEMASPTISVKGVAR